MGKWERVVFQTGSEAFTWNDVVHDARQSGQWMVLEGQASDEIAALRRAESEGALPSAEESREAEAAFRYKRRLVAGDDLRAWLAARDISVGEWRNWVRADLCRRSRPEVSGVDLNGGDIEERLWVTGWCLGLLPRFARDLAGRVAARQRLADGGIHLAPAEAFERFRAQVVTAEALQSAVAANHLEWIMVDCEFVSFADEDAALEGLACLRDDGLGVDELVALGSSVSRRRAAIEDLPDGHRQQFLSAQAGDYLGPVPAGDGFAIAVVRAKSLPSLDDAEVRQRATALVVTRAVEREVEERVRWVDVL